jgi:hypothetical protein
MQTTTSSHRRSWVHANRWPWQGRPRRSRAAAGALLLGGVGLVAAACQPVTAPPPPPPQPVSQYCASSPPAAPSDYQADFNNLRNTYTEWASADGAIPVSLPDGRTVFMFGDTFVGHVNPDGTIPDTDPLIHNSFVVQSGACFVPLMGGAPLARQSLIPNPAPNEFYWPASGVVDSSGTLRVFVWHMEQTSGGLRFQTLGMEVATFLLPSLQLQGVQPLPFSFNATTMPYGATALANSGPGGDGDVYLYGSNQENVYVARAPLGQIMVTPSVWQFYTGADAANPADPSNWSTDVTAARPTTWLGFTPLSFLGASGLPDQAPFAQPWVLPDQTGSHAFLATAKIADSFTADVSVFSAPDPWGPFTYQSSPVTDAPNSPTQVSYGAFTLNPASAAPTIVYSTNINALAQLAGTPQPPYSTQEYGPRFVAPQTGLP